MKNNAADGQTVVGRTAMLRAGLMAAILSASLALLILPSRATAHGGVSIEDDMCIMTIGEYKTHFTGYQPEKRLTQEFCEDIPLVARAIVVLDFISPELRSMDVDFRIVRDYTGQKKLVTLADMGDADVLVQQTVFYRAAKKYPHGTLNISHIFDQPGWYVGMLTATGSDGVVRTSVFPFSVGVASYGKYIAIGVAMGLFALLMWWVAGRFGAQRQHQSASVDRG